MSLEQPTDDNPRARLARRFGLDPDELTELTVEIEAGRPGAVVRWRGVRRLDEAQLAEVLAAELAEAKAEAWDEGEQAGRDNADDGYPDPMVENPYRAEVLAAELTDREVPR